MLTLFAAGGVAMACVAVLAVLVPATWERVRDGSSGANLASLVAGIPLLAVFTVVLVAIEPSVEAAVGALAGLSGVALALYSAVLSLVILGLGGSPRKPDRRVQRRGIPAWRAVIRSRGRAAVRLGMPIAGSAGVVLLARGVPFRTAWSIAMCGAAVVFLGSAAYVAITEWLTGRRRES
ncbi:MAG: hypothetical protein U0547_00320 [Dehalococcoidia bacterium]